MYIDICISYRQDLDEEGLVIGDDVGLRLKVMEFWKCSESGLASQSVNDTDWEPLKIVIAESLPNISTNTLKYLYTCLNNAPFFNRLLLRFYSQHTD